MEKGRTACGLGCVGYSAKSVLLTIFPEDHDDHYGSDQNGADDDRDAVSAEGRTGHTGAFGSGLRFAGGRLLDHSSVENMMSLGMVFSYGKFRFYTAGDFSGPPMFPEVEKAIGAAAGNVDVAKINHHGHHSMPFECVRDLAARVYVACMWDQLHVTADTMERLSDRKAYPGERLICPCVMPVERRRAEGGAAWMKDVPEAVYGGAHIVLSVPPGGESYSLAFLDARDEEMRVLDVRRMISNPPQGLSPRSREMR